MWWLWSKSRSVHDDRGADVRFERWWREQENPRGAVARRRANAAVTNDIERQKKFMILWIVLMQFGVIAGAPLLGQVLPDFPRWSISLAWIAVFILAMVSWQRRRMGRTNQHVAIIGAEEGLCGACGFDAQDLSPGDDGCVVCPECGAAWGNWRRRPSLGAAAPPAGITPKEQRPRGVEAFFAFAVHRSIVDDADKTHMLVRPRDLRARALALPQEQADRLKNVARQLRSQGFIRRLLYAVFFGAMSAFMIFTAISIPTLPSGGFISTVAAVVPWLVGAMFGGRAISVFFSDVGLNRKAARAMLLEEHMCSGCGNDLRQTPRDETGRTACPECGAAWNLPTRWSSTPPTTPPRPCPFCRADLRKAEVADDGRINCSRCRRVIG